MGEVKSCPIDERLQLLDRAVGQALEGPLTLDLIVLLKEKSFLSMSEAVCLIRLIVAHKKGDLAELVEHAGSASEGLLQPKRLVLLKRCGLITRGDLGVLAALRQAAFDCFEVIDLYEDESLSEAG